MQVNVNARACTFHMWYGGTYKSRWAGGMNAKFTVCAGTQTCMCVCVYTNVCVSVIELAHSRACVRACAGVNANACEHEREHKCMRERACAFLSVYVCVQVYTPMRVRV